MIKIIKTASYSLFYFIFWFTLHQLILGKSMPLYALSIAVASGAGYFIASQKGKIALSADGIALPVIMLVIILYAITSYSLGNFPDDKSLLIKNTLDIFSAFTLSFMGAHLSLFALAYLYNKLSGK